jgi:hypothetical protein
MSHAIVARFAHQLGQMRKPWRVEHEVIASARQKAANPLAAKGTLSTIINHAGDGRRPRVRRG